MYSGKNLIGHTAISSWSTTVSDSTPPQYMTFEAVTAATAGTTGLPDESALIYRLENINLMPNGDFETTAGPFPAALPAAWVASGGTNSIVDAGHPMKGQALSFDLSNTEFIEYNLNQLSDNPSAGSLYTYRFSLAGASTAVYKFEIEETVGGDILLKGNASIPVANQSYTVPNDFNEHGSTEFLFRNGSTEVFRINFESNGSVLEGYIDDFRIIKTDQNQALIINIPFADNDRIDSLQLLSGTYRFSIFVKADPELALRNNSFEAKAVTLKAESFNPDGTGDSTAHDSFSAAEHSNFSTWTELTIDTVFQLNTPADTSATAIRLSVSPTDTTGGASTIDTGSILISNPSLLYSENGTF